MGVELDWGLSVAVGEKGIVRLGVGEGVELGAGLGVPPWGGGEVGLFFEPQAVMVAEINRRARKRPLWR